MRAPSGPNSFIFMQFLAKNRLVHPLWELVPPPQENPGSVTVIDAKFFESNILHAKNLFNVLE